MAEHNTLGEQGEAAAVAYLIQHGYTIIKRNWRYRHEEIDIIAETADHLAFVEVKTRSSSSYGSPSEFITKSKQKHLISAANAYVEKYGVENTYEQWRQSNQDKYMNFATQGKVLEFRYLSIVVR